MYIFKNSTKDFFSLIGPWKYIPLSGNDKVDISEFNY